MTKYAWKVHGFTRFHERGEHTDELHDFVVLTDLDKIEAATWRARSTLAILGIPPDKDGKLELEILELEMIGPVRGDG